MLNRLSRGIPPTIAGLLGGLLMLPAAAMAQGMPQLDFNSPLTISQVVWGAIIFVVLYLLLSRQGLPLVASVLEERAAHIGSDLESAHAARTRADAGIGEATAATAKARAESQAAINAALNEAKQAAAAQSEALNARLDVRLHEAEAQIAQARTAALGALRQVATDTAVSVVTRLTGAAPDNARLDTAIGTALSARGLDQGQA
ncbi:F0F1 ATP synthase subunit B' [Rhodopila sp.]|uniref:F0F1 ATP synthase subunit B family protein n=1 Tax=Rhodopila sp. TaxID=2480087 RepID=UPI003D122D21